jgi:hypothetical protein
LLAFDAASGKRFTQQQLQQIPESLWPQLTFRLHPSFRLFTTQCNCVESWQAIKAELEPPAMNTASAMWMVPQTVIQYVLGWIKEGVLVAPASLPPLSKNLD